jgi:hypothetical protein
VRRHLLFQHGLQRPLHDPAQKVRVVQQQRLCQPGSLTTIPLGHRLSSLIGVSNSPFIVEDGGRSRLEEPPPIFTAL